MWNTWTRLTDRESLFILLISYFIFMCVAFFICESELKIKMYFRKSKWVYLYEAFRAAPVCASSMQVLITIIFWEKMYYKMYTLYRKLTKDLIKEFGTLARVKTFMFMENIWKIQKKINRNAFPWLGNKVIVDKGAIMSEDNGWAFLGNSLV